jgi:hypothetical protein
MWPCMFSIAMIVLRLVEDNLEVLCKSCYSRQTLESLRLRWRGNSNPQNNLGRTAGSAMK